jgi:hypothetical protein
MCMCLRGLDSSSSDQWQALVNIIMNFKGPKKQGNFLTIRANISTHTGISQERNQHLAASRQRLDYSSTPKMEATYSS